LLHLPSEPNLWYKKNIGTGVLEYWGVEKNRYFSHYSNTPTLQYSNAPRVFEIEK
jgi:hypothetical protein